MIPRILFTLLLALGLLGQALGGPADLSPYVTCPLTNDPSNTHRIADQELVYRSSAEVDYDAQEWEARVAGSWNYLNKSMLGTAGINIANNKVTPTEIAENARVVAIDIRRHQDQWVYHYFSNGTAFRPIENWSSTKIQAIFLAALKIRHASEGRVGLDSTVSGQSVAQLSSGIAQRSHNDSAAWFKTVMGARGMTSFLHGWMGESNFDYVTQTVTIGEKFLGRYGVPPRALGGEKTRFTGPDGESVIIVRDLKFPGANTLSPLTMAESWKRIFAHEADPATRPMLEEFAMTEADLRTLFYGHSDPKRKAMGGMLLGGVKAGIVNAMGGKKRLDAKTGGQWRIFGKTGSGFSSIRKRHEAVYLGAACFPAAEGGLQQSRAFVFFVNIQSRDPSRRYVIRDKVIKEITRLLVPELFD